MLQLYAFPSSVISYANQKRKQKKKKNPSQVSNNGHAIHKDQIFDDEIIDHKCFEKNLLRFLTNNIARIFKEFCYIRF